MLRIKGKTIYLTRGDTAMFTITIYYPNSSNQEYVVQDGDVVSFTVRSEAKKNDASDFLLQKRMVDGAITIEPEDTAGLDYGEYLYDVEITTASGVVNTIITASPFVIEEEVT